MAKRRISDKQAYLAALTRSVPRFVVDSVMANPTETGLRTYDVTPGSVLVLDLVGFTSLCDTLSHEGAVGLSHLTLGLNQLFSRLLEEAVLPLGGDVIVFGGDAITAVFADQGSTPLGAVRAAAAALRAQALMRGALSSVFAAEGRVLAVRAGVATGMVRHLVIGDVVQRTLSIGGFAPHRAVRAQHLALPGQVVVDAHTALALGPEAVLAPGPDGFQVLERLEVTAPVVLRPPTVGHEERMDEQIAILESFVPPALASRLETTPVGWRFAGELRDVVIVFGEVDGVTNDDISGAGADSMKLVQDMTRSYLRTVRKFGGVAAKLDIAESGHRFLCMFGLRKPADNDAERALLATLENATRLRLAATSRGDRFTLRLGVHAGPVYYGAFGCDSRHDITVVGDTVNVAARAAAAAGLFEVMATDDVMARTGAEFQSSPRPGKVLRGKGDPLTLHVIHGPAEQHAHYVRARKAQRFFAGRADAIAQMDMLARQALAGQGSSLGLWGEQGSGKSAILSPLIDAWTAAGGVGILTRCRYATRSSPLAPVVGMFHQFLGFTARDTDAERAERIRVGLSGFRLEESAEEMAALLMPPRPGDVGSGVDLADAHSRERLLAGVLQFIAQRVSQEPVLYILEDMHHADSLTLEMASRAAAMVKQGRFLFVLTFRPDPVVAGLRRMLSREVELTSLAPPDVQQLVLRELRAVTLDPQLLAFLVQRTQGNPGHLVEIVRFLADRGLVSLQGGMAAVPAAEMALLDQIVPSSMAQVALARLDEFGEVERHLLRTASAIGQRFPSALLESLSSPDVAPAMVAGALATLEGERVFTTETGSVRAYTFRDEVTRAVAYGTIPDDARRAVHRRIADALEALPEGEPARNAAALALHRERAGQPALAAHWYERAALVALSGGLAAEAVQFIERWHHATGLLEPGATPPSTSSGARMALLRLVAAGRLGVNAVTLQCGNDLVEHHWEHLDEPSRRVADRWLGEALLWGGQTDAARLRLMRVFESAEDVALRCDAAVLIARTHEFAGERPLAQQWVTRAREVAGIDAYRAAQVDLVEAHLMIGADELEAACGIYARVQAQARARHQVRLDAMATNAWAHACMHLGRLDDAVQGFSDAARAFHSVGALGEVANALVNLGQTHLWAGHAQQARRPLEDGLQLARESLEDMAITEASIHLGTALALTEDPQAGQAMLDEGRWRAQTGGWTEATLAADLHGVELALAFGRQEDARARLAALKTAGRRMDTPLFVTLLNQLTARAQG